MKTPKSQRGWFVVALAGLIAAGLTAMIIGPMAKSVPELRKGWQAANENPTPENIALQEKTIKKTVLTAQLTTTALNLGTGGDPGDLAQQVLGVALDKYDKSLDSCPAPKKQRQVNSILPPDGNKALNVIESGALNRMLATQVACGAVSNPLPTDVTAAPIAGCSTGTFVCGNGKLICRDKICNNANDCGDNSDEGSSICGVSQSCCQVTNGCPGETGSDCGSSCCCCPYGQACDRVNPGRGCVPSN